MTPSLYFDEDSMTGAVSRALRAAGIDVITAQEADMRGRCDREHLELTTRLGRVLCSKNIGDFQQIHEECMNSGTHHAGIVLIHRRYFAIGEQIRRLQTFAAVRTAEEMRDRLEFLGSWG